MVNTHRVLIESAPRTMTLSSATIDPLQDTPIQRPEYDGIKTGRATLKLAADLQLEGHPEGGFYKETDRSPFLMPNPYHGKEAGSITPTRNFSTLIYYLITPESKFGRFHKNHSRIVHILQKGRGQYVLVYPDGTVKSFKVGFDFANGEVAQWVVPGEVYKASFLLPSSDGAPESEDDCLLISEVVVPGFEFEDHTFMKPQELEDLISDKDRVQSLKWLLGSG